MFLSARKVIDSLEAKSCKEALKWCAENRYFTVDSYYWIKINARSRLKKLESSLEFDLHLQEFVELVRLHDLGGAITYAKKNLAPCAGSFSFNTL